MPKSVFEQEIEDAAAARNARTQQERFDARVAPAEFGYIDTVEGFILSEFVQWGDNNGQSRAIIKRQFAVMMPQMWQAIRFNLWAPSKQADIKHNQFLDVNDAGFNIPVRDNAYYQNTPQGLNIMIDFARNWFSGALGIVLTATGPGGGRGSSGPRGPTAEDIRNQFDIKQLAEQVNILNRALVLEDYNNPVALAREYVDLVVSTLGKVNTDFETFVRERIEKTSRFKSIYRTKPEAVSAEQYLAPFFNAAMGLAPPDEAAELAIGGAQFGATAEQFTQRLKRTDAVTGSSAFINGLETRLTSLNSIFKG